MRLIYFGASWCGQCRVLKPQVQSFCKEKGIEMIEYDAEENEDKAADYNVRNLPTIIVEDGELAIRAIGIDGWNSLKKDLQDE